MRPLTNIIKKELKELLTPATILPVIIIAILYGSIGTSMEGIEDELSQKPVIGLINLDEGIFGEKASSILYNSSEIIFNSTDFSEKENGLEYLKNNEASALLIIQQNFSYNIFNNKSGKIEIYWIMGGTGILGAISSSGVESLISLINHEISKMIITENSSVNPDIALYPSRRIETTYYKDLEFKGMSPGSITGVLFQQSLMISIMIMIIIAASAGTVISSMALEKENKTLETLLTLPVKRTHIVIGKIVASASIGLLFAVIFMLGMSRYLGGMSFSDGGGPSLGLQLTTTDFLLIGVLLFITLIAALALSMLLGTLAKNYKSAQTLTFPVTMLALIPMFLTMFTDFESLPILGKMVLFAIPFSHPMMAPKALIFNDYALVFGGIIYVTIFAAILITIVAWIFKTDKLLTGSTRKFKNFSFKKFKR